MQEAEISELWKVFLSPSPWNVLLTSTLDNVVWFFQVEPLPLPLCLLCPLIFLFINFPYSRHSGMNSPAALPQAFCCFVFPPWHRKRWRDKGIFSGVRIDTQSAVPCDL